MNMSEMSNPNSHSALKTPGVNMNQQPSTSAWERYLAAHEQVQTLADISLGSPEAVQSLFDELNLIRDLEREVLDLPACVLCGSPDHLRMASYHAQFVTVVCAQCNHIHIRDLPIHVTKASATA